jgi:hypothetical protein
VIAESMLDVGSVDVLLQADKPYTRVADNRTFQAIRFMSGLGQIGIESPPYTCAEKL